MPSWPGCNDGRAPVLACMLVLRRGVDAFVSATCVRCDVDVEIGRIVPWVPTPLKRRAPLEVMGPNIMQTLWFERLSLVCVARLSPVERKCWVRKWEVKSFQPQELVRFYESSISSYLCYARCKMSLQHPPLDPRKPPFARPPLLLLFPSPAQHSNLSLLVGPSYETPAPHQTGPPRGSHKVIHVGRGGKQTRERWSPRPSSPPPCFFFSMLRKRE